MPTLFGSWQDNFSTTASSGFNGFSFPYLLTPQTPGEGTAWPIAGPLNEWSGALWWRNKEVTIDTDLMVTDGMGTDFAFSVFNGVLPYTGDSPWSDILDLIPPGNTPRQFSANSGAMTMFLGYLFGSDRIIPSGEDFYPSFLVALTVDTGTILAQFSTNNAAMWTDFITATVFGQSVKIFYEIAPGWSLTGSTFTATVTDTWSY